MKANLSGKSPGNVFFLIERKLYSKEIEGRIAATGNKTDVVVVGYREWLRICEAI